MLRRRWAASACIAALMGGVTATPMPATADLGEWFKASDLALSDGAGISTWTGSIAATAITSAGTTQPIYKAAKTGGKPAVTFNGLNQWFNVGRPTSLINALTQGTTSTGYTMFFVTYIEPTSTGPFRTLWSPTNVNTHKTFVASNSGIGDKVQPRPVDMSGFQVIAVRCSSVYTNNPTANANVFVGMNCWSSLDGTVDASANYALGHAGTAGQTWGIVGDVQDFGWYNRALSNAEITNLIKHFCDQYGQAYPWAGLTELMVADGDSESWGVGATSSYTDNWVTQLALLKGRSHKSFCSLAVPSRTSSQMTASAAGNYTGWSAALGIPIKLFAFEYYNQPETTATNMKGFLAAVKSADPTIKIGCLTSIDNGQLAGTTQHDNRAAFNTALAGSANIDVLIPIHTDTTMGVEGACPDNPGPYGTYFSDIIGHPTTAGYTKVRDFVAPYYDKLMGPTVSASMRASLPNAEATVSVAGAWRSYRHLDKTNASVSNVFAVLYNGYILATGANQNIEVPSGGVQGFRAAIVTGIGSNIGANLGGTVKQLTFNEMLYDADFVAAGGSVTDSGRKVIVPSATGNWWGVVRSDSGSGVTLSKGDRYSLQIEVSEPQAGQFTTSWHRCGSTSKFTAYGDRVNTHGADPGGATAYSTTFGNDSGSTGFQPAAVFGTSTSGAKTVILHGNSIEWGTAGAGSTMDTPDSDGVIGWAKKALNILGYSVLDLTTAGSAVNHMYTYAAYPVRQKIMQMATAGVVLSALGTNDRSTAGSWTGAIVTRFQWYWDKLHTWAGPGVPVVQAVLGPKTTSTDAWATEANQTDVVGSTHWCELTFNPSLRSGNFAALGTGTSAPDAAFDMPAAVIDSTKTKWATSTPAHTIDGLHPAAEQPGIGHGAMKTYAVANLPAVIPFSAPS